MYGTQLFRRRLRIVLLYGIPDRASRCVSLKLENIMMMVWRAKNPSKSKIQSIMVPTLSRKYIQK
jgi:hypothetical protein